MLQRVVKLGDLLHSLGFEFEIPTRPTPIDFLRILDESLEHPAADSVQTAVLRTMNQARYTVTPDRAFWFGLRAIRSFYVTHSQVS
jgi:exoribonuclease R